MIAIQINRKAGIVSDALWSVLLRGPGVIERSKQPPNPDKSVISDVAWDLATFLDFNFANFKGLCAHINAKKTIWVDYIKC